MRQDIFPHFLFLETRRLQGLFKDRTKQQQKEWLRAALNLSAIICEDRVLLPFGAAIECDIAYELLAEEKFYFQTRLINASMRENSIGEVFEKKRLEYSPMKESHSGLYDDQRIKFLSDNVQAISQRDTKIGQSISKNWERRPDSRDPIWRKITKSIGAKEIDEIRKIPGILIENRFAVAWDAFKKHLPEISSEHSALVRRALLREFFFLYIKEYKLHVLGRVPTINDDLELSRNTRLFSFDKIESMFRVIALEDLIFESNAERVFFLKLNSGFTSFIDAICELERHPGTRTDLLFYVDWCAKLIKFDWRKHKLIRSPMLNRQQEVRLEELSDALGELAYKLNDNYGLPSRNAELARRCDGTKEHNRRGGNKMKRRSNNEESPVTIFVALREELEILVKRLGFSKNADQPAASGKIGDIAVDVVCPNNMGRVAATVELALYLSGRSSPPGLIVVAGLAGGFPEEGTKVGHIVFGTTIVDMASRKVRDEEGEAMTKTEFRRRDYPLSDAIDRFAFSDLFNRDFWLEEAREFADWPDDRQPAIRTGLLACCDEVVSSNQWRKKLLDGTPKLLGIEMESGGVCAIAERYKIPVAVVRTISDDADPSKKDDNWRKIGMKTVSVLLEHIDFREVLKRV